MSQITMPPKLIVTDWDGTFAEQGGKPRPEALRAKDQLIAKGSLVVLVSGRSVKEVLGYVSQYGLSSEFIAELGTVIYYDGKAVINHGNVHLYKEKSSYPAFIKLLDEVKMSAHDAMFQIGIVDKVLHFAQEQKMPLRIFTPKDGRPEEKGTNLMEKKGTVLMRGNIKTNTITELLLDKESPFLEIIDNGLVEDNSGDHAYHLLIKGANKDSAVLILQALLKIKKEESIALGDSVADLSLAYVVGHFYLMRNSFSHTPDILERFKQSSHLPPKDMEQLMNHITITKVEAGLGWAEVANDILDN